MKQKKILIDELHSSFFTAGEGMNELQGPTKFFYQDAAYKENGNIKGKFREDTPRPLNTYLTVSATENKRSSEKAILKKD